MTKQDFKHLLEHGLVFLDGATGSNLQQRGMPAGVCPELWITEHPQVIRELQREYIEAGSHIIYAPTFSGNRIKMAEYGLKDRMAEINTCLVEISREAAAGQALVAGDITMTGAQLEPLGDLTFEELLDVYKEQIGIIAEAGIDLLGVETMMSLSETRAAVLAAKEVCPDLPVMATLSFTESGNTLYGASAESAVVVLQQLGVDAVGLNCSAGPDQMLGIIERMKKVAKVPLIAKPNAGLPQIGADGQTVYDMDEDSFAEYMVSLVQAGAHLVGGCCGSSPEYIEKLSRKVADMIPLEQTQDDSTLYLADERQIYPFVAGQQLELGEGIDYTKETELLEEYQDEIFDTAQDLAFDLQDEEADALLFCAAGLPEEAEILKNAVSEVTGMVRMPVVIAVSEPQIAKEVLASYSGVAAVMPLTEDPRKVKEMENLIKLYGAAVVSLDKKIRYC